MKTFSKIAVKGGYRVFVMKLTVSKRVKILVMGK